MLLMMLLTTTTAWAETKTVSYIDADGTQKSVEATVLTGNEEPNSDGYVILSSGWYAVTHDISYTNPIRGGGGTIHVILCDGAEMNVEVNECEFGSIEIGFKEELVIYGQTAGTGRLSVAYNDKCALWANGSITINGGIVSANGSIGIYAGERYKGLTINGGIVSAYGTLRGMRCSNLIINGGQVTATCGSDGIDYGFEIWFTVTIGLSKASDFIRVSKYDRAVNIKSGQRLTDGTNIYTGDGVWLPNNKTLRLADFTDNGDDTYFIGSAAGWNMFCDAMQDNTTYNRFCGKTVKLVDDIEVDCMAGSSGHEFMGEFDGQGHSITLAIGTTDSPVTEEYAAPFRNVHTGANIHSIVVDGYIYTSNKYAAGIVGNQYGTVTISNCHVSTIIHSSKSGDGTHGGIVANQYGGALTLSGCVFDGRLLTTNGTTNCGGLVGYHSAGTCTVSNCLYAPTDVALATGESYITNGATFCRNYSGTPDNCYYTELLGETQGKQVHSITAGECVSVANAGSVTNYSVSGITCYGIGIKYGDVLYAASGDEVSLSLSNTPPAGGVLSAYTVSPDGVMLVKDGGNYTLTMPDASVIIGATFDVIFSGGNGTEEAPYIITNQGDWENLCNWIVNNFDNCKDKHYILGADISATKLVGDKSHPFCGTFDGNGHALTVNYSGNTTFIAPFRYVSGTSSAPVVIKNLHIAGTIANQNKYTGGIVGRVLENGCVTIENCRSSADIVSTYDGNDGRLSGIVSRGDGNTTINIKDCVFDGSINAVNGVRCAGFFVSWGSNVSVSIENCLFSPTAINVAGNDNKTFGPSDNTLTNCYYTKSLGDIQGSKGIMLYDSGVPATANEGVISRCNGNKYSVKLQGRTLYKDGDWNTLCLPFAINNFTGTPLGGATVKELLTTSNLDNNGVLTLNFNAVSSIEAGKPYIVKWESGSNRNNPIFTNVTIDDTNHDVAFTGGSFKGNYSPLEITDANRNDILLLAGGNKLGYAKTDRTIANGKALGACRAYFYIPSNGGGQGARAFELNFGEEETTGIVSTTDGTDITDKAGVIYDLQGRKVENPKKGMYIVNGKMVVIK